MNPVVSMKTCNKQNLRSPKRKSRRTFSSYNIPRSRSLTDKRPPRSGLKSVLKLKSHPKVESLHNIHKGPWTSSTAQVCQKRWETDRHKTVRKGTGAGFYKLSKFYAPRGAFLRQIYSHHGAISAENLFKNHLKAANCTARITGSQTTGSRQNIELNA